MLDSIIIADNEVIAESGFMPVNEIMADIGFMADNAVMENAEVITDIGLLVGTETSKRRWVNAMTSVNRVSGFLCRMCCLIGAVWFAGITGYQISHRLHGIPAMGRGMAEFIAHGEFRTLDLSPFGFQRIERGEPFMEKAII